VFTLYEIITRDMSFREENYPHELDAAVVLQMEEWVQHPDVRLEEGVTVAEYRRVLEEWVHRRREVDGEFRDYKQAPELFDWPALPEFPLVECAGSMERRPARMRRDVIRRGEASIKWYVCVRS
jgi:hypothetical protein